MPSDTTTDINREEVIRGIKADLDFSVRVSEYVGTFCASDGVGWWPIRIHMFGAFADEELVDILAAYVVDGCCFISSAKPTRDNRILNVYAHSPVINGDQDSIVHGYISNAMGRVLRDKLDEVA